MNEMIDLIEKEHMRLDLIDVNVGDSVKVYTKIYEGDKERIQMFEGVVIGKRGGNTRATFTVRKVSYGVGVEKTFPKHSPLDREDRGIEQGEGTEGQALLPEGSEGQSGKAQRKKGLMNCPLTGSCGGYRRSREGASCRTCRFLVRRLGGNASSEGKGQRFQTADGKGKEVLFRLDHAKMPTRSRSAWPPIEEIERFNIHHASFFPWRGRSEQVPFGRICLSWTGFSPPKSRPVKGRW